MIKKGIAKNCLEMLAETADENDDYKKFSGQFGKCLKPCDQVIRQERIVEQIADVHVPEIMEEIVEVAKIVQQGRVQQHTVEEIVDVPVPQFLEEMVEVIKAIHQARMTERIFEQIVNVPVSRDS